jgi:hypothetical protein
MRHRPWGRRSLSQSRFKATMKLLGGPVHRRERNGELAKSLWEEPLFSGLYLSPGLGVGRCSAISVLTAPSESEAVACRPPCGHPKLKKPSSGTPPFFL